MSGRPWTEEELQVVKDMFPDHFASEIAQILGRSEASIYL